MITEWLIACLLGISKIFLNPLLYLSFIFCWIVGRQRVKRERLDFNTKIFDSSNELRMMLPQGLLWGLILSIDYAWNGISYSDSVDFDYGCYDGSFGIDDECPT